MQDDQLARTIAALYNAAWWVRWHQRPHQGEKRAKAIRELGLAARAAFNATEDFEPLLRALAQLEL